MKTVYENKWFSIINNSNFFWLEEKIAGAVSIIESPSHLLFVKTKRLSQNNEELIESVRGYSEHLESGTETIIREISEETSLDSRFSIKSIGYIRPNTAIISGRIPVYLVSCFDSFDMSKFKSNDEVHDYLIIEKSDIFNFIIRESLECGITLSALMLYISDANS